VKTVVETFSKYGPKIAPGGCAHFARGFEKHAIYEVATSIAKNRLYIWGRKNRKLFDKDHASFFEGLSKRVHAGFDLRLLFLDPSAPNAAISQAHHDKDLREQLRTSLGKAIATLRRVGLAPKQHCRTYVCPRHKHIIVVDNAVLFTPLKCDPNGVALPLTDSPFCVVSSSFGHGDELSKEFLKQWDAATPVP
jgi:hypothetical protein